MFEMLIKLCHWTELVHSQRSIIKTIVVPNNLKCRFMFVRDPISGRVDRASATETLDTGSIPGRVEPKTV